MLTAEIRALNSELVFGVDNWDVQFEGDVLTSRSGPADILVGLRFDPPSSLSIERGKLSCNGVQLDIRPDGLRANDGDFRAESPWWRQWALLSGVERRPAGRSQSFSPDRQATGDLT